MSRYIITITERTQEKKIIGRKWERGVEESEGDSDGWGYAPEVESTEDVEREVFKQNVDVLNITDVIKAINGIGDEV